MIIPKGAFENDGCTFWFDQWFDKPVRQCCDAHDQAFSVGTTVVEFIQANIAIIQCGFQQGASDWAILTGIGVFILGFPLFFLGNKTKKTIYSLFNNREEQDV